MVWREDKNRDLEPLLIILLFLVLLFGGIKVKEYIDAGFPFWSILTGVKLDTKESYKNGTVVKGFPEYLLQVVEDAKVMSSSRTLVTQNDKTSEYLTVIFDTKAPPGDIYGAYATLLQERSYLVKASPGAENGFLAVGKENDIAVSISNFDANTREVRLDVKNPTLPSSST